VADNPAKDFAAPASLGWRAVRVVRPGGLHALAPSGADVERELSDLTTLPELLGIAT
jgi:FMN phosphatase YigB (HAD superfamily)